ncbi:hypothetical protein F4814DRAFT_421770 [Daldinia grandis]|nr:hypothetical protein F4814DRAFT_421770 [Daldinia grandis]
MAETRSQLLYLPAETICCICKGLLPDILGPYRTFRDYDATRRSASNLASLALVCKLLNTIATPILARCKGHPLEAGVIPYIYTIIQNPDIASHERTFRLHPSDHNGLLEESHIQALDARAQSLGVVLPSSYRADLIPRPNINARYDYRVHNGRTSLVYILLASLPNLSSYSIYTTSEPLFPANRLVARFDTLRQIRVVGYSDIPLSLDMANFRRYTHYSRSIEVFESVGMEVCSRIIYLDQVHTIRLLSCRISSCCVGRVVGICSRNLKTFVFRSGYHSIYLQRGVRPGESRGRRRLGATPWDIVHALTTSLARISLETLEIDMREHFNVKAKHVNGDSLDAGTPLLYNFINGFHSFPALRHLTLTQQTLWESWLDNHPGLENKTYFCDELRLVDMLPPYLESFTLYDVTVRFLPCIGRLARQIGVGRGFPNLKKLTLRPSPNFARQLIHVRKHNDNPELPLFDDNGKFCGVDSRILSQWGWIVVLLKIKGVQFDCVPEAHPLDTDNQKVLWRQRRLQHWCERCHFNSSVCVERKKWFGVYAD